VIQMTSTTRTLLAGLAICALGACATAGGVSGPHGLHRMPADLADAHMPEHAGAERPADLAEGALHLLDPDRPGGPDYTGAARLCLIAAESARMPIERELRVACYRVAARSALRSGERDLYVTAVQRWEDSAPRHERVAGELAVHLAIRDGLAGAGTTPAARLPFELRRLIPDPEEETP